MNTTRGTVYVVWLHVCLFSDRNIISSVFSGKLYEIFPSNFQKICNINAENDHPKSRQIRQEDSTQII